jgi:hypothetical protein
MTAGAASPVWIDCQQRGGFGGVWVILAESRSGSKMGSFRGSTAPKTPWPLSWPQSKVTLRWDFSLVGVRRFQRERGRRGGKFWDRKVLWGLSKLGIFFSYFSEDSFYFFLRSLFQSQSFLNCLFLLSSLHILVNLFLFKFRYSFFKLKF